MNGRLMRDQGNHGRWIILMVALMMVGAALVAPTASVFAQETEDAGGSDGYTYTVQDGDNWDSVAATTGVSVDALQAANPDAVRETGWLLTGEELTVPLPEQVERVQHTVTPGESWSTIADDYGVSMEALQAANQKSIRTGMILYNGEKLLIPPAPTEEETDEEDAAAAPEEAGPAAGEQQPAEEGVATAEDSEAEGADAEEIAADEPAAEVPVEESADQEDVVGAEQPDEQDVTSGTETEAGETAETDAAAAVEAEAEEGAAEVDAGADEASVEADVDATEEVTATAPITETAIDADIPEADAAGDGEAEETAVEEAVDTSDEAALDEAAEEADTADADAAGEETVEGAAEEALSLPECPELLTDYPDAVVAVLNASDGDGEELTAFLTACGAQVEEGVVAQDLTGDEIEEFVVVYQNPSEESTFVESDLIILSLGEEGYEVDYRARAAGEVRLAATEDINDDGQADVVWTDTTCGASTCFDTVNVRSWDGSVWADWTDGTITMAYADIELADVQDEGTGQEIVLTGGIYGSVGAGPQRSRTETWSSMEGAPYALTDKVYSDSECLYHTVLDANRALSEASVPEDLAAARELYEKAVADESLIKCWVRPAELEELRSFSLFRLALIDVAEGNLEQAGDRITELAATYPDIPIAEAAQTWLEEFEADGVLEAACDAVTAYAQDHPEVWEILADYGYTNPSFEASDLCRPPDVSGEDAEEGSAENGATGASPRSDLGAVAAEAGATDDAGTETDTDPEPNAGSDDDIAAIAENLPDCPDTLAEYAEALPLVLSQTDGDGEILQRWLYACGSLSEDRGAVVSADLNGDDIEDFAVFPTLISDIGLGPDGAQGAVYLVHSEPDGTYTVAANPEIFGEPSPLAIGDLNGDGNSDVAWTVEGCSTFCVLETQIVSWDGSEYTSLIEPGAAIASGTAKFEDVATGEAGTGQSLVLSGGVSGTPEGGLTVPHEEVWQSVDGGPFERVSWDYDRDAEGSNCLGLRLVEADVALHAADALGYGPAFEKYAKALEPGLEACSIFGLQPEEELALLQGLANFRLIQVQALDEDVEGARASLDFFAEVQAGSPYVEAAQQWLDAFEASGDAAAACSGISTFLEEHPDMWQITDHFGYNHPALAAEQICFVP